MEEGVYWMYTTDEKRVFSISESRAKFAWAMPNAEKGDEIEIWTEKDEKDDAGYFLKVSISVRQNNLRRLDWETP